MSEEFHNEIQETMSLLEKCADHTRIRVQCGRRRGGKMLVSLEEMIRAVVEKGMDAIMIGPEFVVMTRARYEELMGKWRE